YQTTIAAEADDLKYESKYKELKKKVKEVEEDNEQLYVKILQAQQNIQRLRLERALIYERLSTLAPPATAPAPSHSHGHPTSDEGPHHPHSHSHSSNPGGGSGGGVGGSGSSSAAGGNGGVGGGGHHPHPLSQSFTASSISRRDMERDIEPISNGSTYPHPISPHTRERAMDISQQQSLPPPPSSSSYSPTRGPSSREDAHMHIIPHHPKPREKESSSALPPILSAVGVGGGGFADGRTAYHHPLSQSTVPLRESGERRHSPAPGGY
ncbi:hypothetical protein FRC15_004585, partial [Serendipita sp. 397]